jgi:NifU-like protein involved in Fe-S cluster formation
MDEIITKYYKNLLKIRFEYFGSLVNPSIFIDSAGEHVYYCGSGNDFMQLFIKVVDNAIADIKYSCFCIPTANVAIEILCTLVIGKNLNKVVALTEQDICDSLGTDDEEFRKKTKAILELLNIGIKRFKNGN